MSATDARPRRAPRRSRSRSRRRRASASASATAAYQIEGSTLADGRGESIWDRFAHTPGRSLNGDTGDVACDHYRRWRQDLDLMASLHVESYRFSIAWPRILPTGSGTVNQRGLDFYKRLAEGLRERGIEPVATLYHWDLPQALQNAGGWAERDTALRFAEYARIVGAELGDVVESLDHAERAVVHGVPGPRLRDQGAGDPRLADGAARQPPPAAQPRAGDRRRCARRCPTAAEVGIALNLFPVVPARRRRGAPRGRADPRRLRQPLVPGPGLPRRVPGGHGRSGTSARPAPRSTRRRTATWTIISAPNDFLGVNYYNPMRVEPSDESPLRVRDADVGRAGHRHGLGDQARRPARDPRARPRPSTTTLPIMITENGSAFEDGPVVDGQLDDPQRRAYLAGHLEAVGQAIADGSDVRRYYVWSLLDNFEWEEGYDQRFGIVHVDFDTQARTPKASALFYRDYIDRARKD